MRLKDEEIDVVYSSDLHRSKETTKEIAKFHQAPVYSARLASVILGMVLGHILFIYSLQLIGASRATPISASSPVWVSIIASVFMKEKVTSRLLSSSAIVVIGIYFLY